MNSFKMKSILKYVLIVFISVVLSFSVFYMIFLNSPRFAKLKAIDDLVQKNFYGEYDKNTIDDMMFSGYMEALGDKYAAYYNAEQAEQKHSSEMGNFFGIGVSVTKYPDTELIYVNRVYQNGSAYNAGIKRGDIITHINDVDMQEKGFTKSVDGMQGESDKEIKLTVKRDNDIIDFNVKFSECEIQSVYYSVVENIGYIQITSFNSATVAQFKNAVNDITQQSVKGIVFDLRNNGGGTVDSVCKILDSIMPQGTIMSVKYADGQEKIVHVSDQEQLNLPMAVITNSNTASAAELFAATIRDFNKGVLVGEKTYGKGVMQQTYPLFDGSSVKFTVAEYFPHSGKNFDGIGLEPDIKVELNQEQIKYFYQLDITEDPQVLQAIRWINEN